MAFLWLPHYCVGRVVFDVAGGFGTKEAWAGDAGIATDGTDGVSTTLPSTTHEALLAMGVAFGVYASLVLLLEHAGAVDAAARRARRRVASRASSRRFVFPNDGLTRDVWKNVWKNEASRKAQTRSAE